MFIYDVVSRSAMRWPDSVAVSDGREEELTFGDVNREVTSLARGLRALGLRAGDRVIDLQTNSVSYVLTDLAIPTAGLVRVAVNYRLTATELEYIVKDSGATAIVYGDAFGDVADELLAACPGLKYAVGVTDSGRGHNLASVKALAEQAPMHRGGGPADLVSINYSSGTTGKPKGCMRTARNRQVSTMDFLISVFDGKLDESDVVLHAGPITHASGLLVLPALAVGARQDLTAAFDPTDVLDRLESGEATVTVLVPTMLERVMAALSDRDVAFSRLRAVVYAGAPMPAERIKAARSMFDGRLVQFYGMVESIPPVTVLDMASHADDTLLSSAGRPPLGVHLEVVGPQGRPCEPGELGEVVVGGDHLMSGYWGNNYADGKALRNGMLRTGDVGRVDERGYLYLVDRQGDMVITGGYNVYPREVEDVIRDFEGVRDVAVVGVPDPDWGQAVTAFLVQEVSRDVDLEALADWCADRLARFKKPKQFVVVDDLPKTKIGKIDRKALATMLAQA